VTEEGAETVIGRSDRALPSHTALERDGRGDGGSCGEAAIAAEYLGGGGGTAGQLRYRNAKSQVLLLFLLLAAFWLDKTIPPQQAGRFDPQRLFPYMFW
jgi:hypothetical protein